MNKSRGLSERTSDIVLVAITAVVLIIVAYPLYYVMSSLPRSPIPTMCTRARPSCSPAASPWTDMRQSSRTPTLSPAF